MAHAIRYRLEDTDVFVKMAIRGQTVKQLLIIVKFIRVAMVAHAFRVQDNLARLNVFVLLERLDNFVKL